VPPNRNRTINEPSLNQKKSSALSVALARPESVPEQTWFDYLAVRKAKKAPPITATALAGLEREAAIAGVTLESAIQTCCERNWVGFNAGWLAAKAEPSPRAKHATQKTASDKRAEALFKITGGLAGRAPTDDGVIDVEPFGLKQIAGR
jgi:hypothetical protein